LILHPMPAPWNTGLISGAETGYQVCTPVVEGRLEVLEVERKVEDVDVGDVLRVLQTA
jgi:hypothetical protein